MVETPSRGPLAGRRVLELAGIGPGPFACMLLADLGAEVIRIDRPTGSGIAPPASKADVLNRGKRSIVLDLKRQEAVEAVLTLAETADVLVEGNRPGVTERLGVGPEDVWTRNPKLVYGRMTGWGQQGPLAHTAGHDIGYIAVTGALGAIGSAGGPPQIPLNLVGDFGGGSLYLVTGVLAALLEAERTGHGQVVDAAIVDGASHLMGVIHSLLGSGRWVDQRGENLLDGGAPYYSVYETADGGYMAVGAIEPKFYAELLRLLGLPAEQVDPAAQNDRGTWPQLRALLADTFRGRTRAEWTAVFEGSDACVAPVVGLREAAAHTHVAARGSVLEVDEVLQPGQAPRFSAHPGWSPALPPAPGRDTREVLSAAGLDVSELLKAGIAVEP
ncbi:carnitine dehydratase (plasmid) [Pseudonocardia sp. EC080610-09]|uniref:CaiB/BaiF CoA transferase family protein n=1 Tax=unclassified Pseudonocardia TaxID=2619320 RepID=UPI000706A22A|nr:MULTISPECIES: CaiB/BaiF CoA-transferase family protein [unclassified Pseudonocardia]ALL79708.1 carnitine dehydratase [Pseudonocardia sp. EC080610-09]ALL85677.1 carnitine dehydratase [Pseudonocardia sp. EC080619-01]